MYTCLATDVSKATADGASGLNRYPMALKPEYVLVADATRHNMTATRRSLLTKDVLDVAQTSMSDWFKRAENANIRLGDFVVV